MKRSLLFLIVLLVALPAALFALQDGGLRVEITGVDPTQLPEAIITANVYDALGQPVNGLDASAFTLTGRLAEAGGRITQVQNLTDDNIPFATVLVLDVSSSMAGIDPATAPFELAKQAARTFVQNVRDNDQVALMIFSSTVRVVQTFTSDKNVLLAAIDSIPLGGETALYQASYDAVRLAAESPLPRRVVILLSDGAEFGGVSRVERDDAALEALTRGVPVYTIGLGFGTDRSYMQQLAARTNARYYESPTPQQLDGIYRELAALLRSQYVITVRADVPLDGTEYPFGIRATSNLGSGEAFATLRAPVPVPVIRLDGLTGMPIRELTTLTASIAADQDVTAVNFALGDQPGVSLTAPPYSVAIDPAIFQPGDVPLTIAATDADGDTGFLTVNVPIAALPPTLTFTPDPATLGAIAEPVTFTFTPGGQTAITEVSVSIDSADPVILSEPYTFTLNPVQLSPGAHTLRVRVVNAGGMEAIASLLVQVAAVPPTVQIIGLQPGQAITTVTGFTAVAIGQGTVNQISAAVGDVPLPLDSSGLFALDPALLPPGAVDVVVTASTENGVPGSASVSVLIGALPPQIAITGLDAGATVSADTTITIQTVSQTPITALTAEVDTAAPVTLTDPTFTLRVLDYPPGARTLTITARNAGGESGSLVLPFTIDPAPAASATAVVVAQLTATQAAIDATATQVAVIATATQQAVEAAATGTQTFLNAAATQVAVDAAATQAAIAATATQQAVNAAATQAAVEAAATGTQTFLNAAATQQSVDATATQQQVNAVATQVAGFATATQQSVDATATQQQVNAAATQVAGFATATQQSVDATATQQQVNAAATQVAGFATATQQSIDATATQDTLNATATQDAVSAAATQAALIATATQQSIDATATQDTLNATATQDAVNVAATQVAGFATATQQSIDATATQDTLNATATQDAISAAATQAALIATATQQSIDATATQDTLNATATQDAVNAAATQAALIATATQQSIDATATQAVFDAATQSAVDAAATQQSIDATATRARQVSDVQATLQAATREALATSAAEARAIAQATQDARATRLAQETARAATATQNAVDAAALTATQIIDQATAAALTARTATQAAEEVQQNLFLATATQLIREATATAEAQATATQAAIDAAATQAAIDAAATAEQAARLADATATAISQALATETQSAINAAGTQTALSIAATGTAEAAATTRAAILAADNAATASAIAATATQSAIEAAATQAVRDATAAARLTAEAVSSEATISAQLTAVAPPLTAVAQAATDAPTPTPQGTLTPVTSTTPPVSGDSLPIALVIIAVVVILLLLFFALRGNRNRRA